MRSPGQGRPRTADSILGTKLHAPAIRSDVIPRPRLLERLEKDVRRPLTVVSAPAGYGKSTLAAQWLEASGLPGVWLSLDDGDSELRVFVRYLVAAVRGHSPKACGGSWDVLGAAQLPPPAVLAEQLANELEAIRRPFILVLDDYQRITGTDVHDLLDLLLEHPPRPLHLAILTRSDPPLRVAAMRARGLALEVREPDLRFSAQETQAVVERVANVSLDQGALTHVMEELEGWIVGLRLVCLAWDPRDDPEAYLSGLQGDVAQVQEYLVEQVLAHQPPALQTCLLKTSILNRFCAPLCEAVCLGDERDSEGTSGQDFMRAVDGANLFAVSLDAQGEWLRYHHLFQQLLRRLLEKRAGSEEVQALHGRASRWFASQGLVAEALEHALAAGEVGHAADIVEQHRLEVLNADRWPVLAGWLAALPDEVIWRRPELLLGEAWVAYYRFRIPELARIVERLDSLLGPEAAGGAWDGEASMFKAFLCYWQGEAEQMLGHVGRAQTSLPATHDLMRADSEIYFGLAHHMAGEKEVAIEALTGRIRRHPEQRGLLRSRQVITLAFIHVLAGNLKQAAVHSRQLEELARTCSPVYIRSWATFLLACCHFQAGDWEGAERGFRWMVANRYVSHTAAVMSSLLGLGLSLHFMGRVEESAEVGRQLLDFALETKDPGNLDLAMSGQARLGLLQGSPPTPSEQPSHEAGGLATAFLFLDVPEVTRCRCLLAQGSKAPVAQALAVLDRLRQAAEAIHNTFHLIDIVALQAVAQHVLGRADEATASLEHVLELAAPGGWIRPFVEPGPPMADLLGRLRARGERVAQIDRLLAAFPGGGVGAPKTVPTSPPAARSLVEPLTNRELDVLELLAKRLYDKEIASELRVSTATVKTHLRHIYEKLAVGNRRQAVIKAQDLAMLGRT